MKTLDEKTVGEIVKTVRKVQEENLPEELCLEIFECTHNFYSTQTIEETLVILQDCITYK